MKDCTLRGQVKLDYILELDDREALAHLLVGMMEQMQVRRLVVYTTSVYRVCVLTHSRDPRCCIPPPIHNTNQNNKPIIQTTTR